MGKFEDGNDNLCNIASTLGDRTNDYRGPNVTRLAAASLAKGSVLDIGCGNGFYMRMLSGSGFDVHGLEPSADMIRKSRIFGKMDIRRGKAEGMLKVFGGRRFDNIMMIDVLEHIKDDRKALNDACRLLTDGGNIVILVPAYQSLFSKRDRMYGHYRRYSAKELRSKMEDAGFEILKLRHWGALTLPLYAIYCKTDFDMEQRYLAARSRNGIGNRMLGSWFKNVENRMSFGFGINLFCVGRKLGAGT